MIPRRLLSVILLVSLAGSNVVFAQVPQIKWQYDLEAPAFGQAAMADLDGDSLMEIVFSTYMNEGKIHCLNAEDGSKCWEFQTGGCNDAAPLICDADLDGKPDVILASSCVAMTYCLDGATGSVKWQAVTGGTDSPPVSGDVDNDGRPEILHGEFNGGVICLNGENGSEAWELIIDPNCSIQTSPALLDLDGDGQLDFVVAAWSFNNNHHIWAYRGDNRQLLWESTVPGDVIYHGASFGDIDGDSRPELAFGCYDNHVYVFNGEDGSLAWPFDYGPYMYVGSPVAMGDLDGDLQYELVAAGWYKMKALRNDGTEMWNYNMPGYPSCFRGPALADVDGDDLKDVIFGTSDGQVTALAGFDGSELWTLDLAVHYGDTLEIDHAPLIGDFDNDGILEAFVVGGFTAYPNISGDYGRAYCITAGTGTGPAWTMFQHDAARSCRVAIDTLTVLPPSPADDPMVRVIRDAVGGGTRIVLQFAAGQEGGMIELYDMAGRVVVSRVIPAPVPSCGVVLEIPGGTIRHGLFLLRTNMDGEISVRKIQIGI